MKRKSLTLAILTSMLVMTLSGCDFLSNLNPTSQSSDSSSPVSSNTSVSSETSADSGSSVVSETSENAESVSSETSDETSTKESSVPSDTVSTTEGSDSDSDTSADTDESSADADSSEESTDESSYEYSEQTININYRNPSVFTDNDEFNQLFENNSIDTAYKEAARETDGTTSSMRSLVQEYAKKWEDEVDTAYEILCNELADNEEQLTQLRQSQQEWLSSVDAVEQNFIDEQRNQGGSVDLLAADTQMLNYNKARAASLYEEIFVLTGDFRME